MTRDRPAGPAREVLVLVVGICLAMLFIETRFVLSYPVRSAVKAGLFLLPTGVWMRVRGVPARPLLAFRSGREAAKAVGLGLGTFVVILGAYVVLRSLLDPDAIAGALLGNMQVHAGNFLWVALYISLGNSLLEELLFRGFAFLVLRELLPGRAAWIFSAASFALYHLAMIRGFFTPVLFLLAMAGLFVGGLLFNWLDARSGSVLPGWVVHLCANLAINTVGLIVLGLI